MSDKETLQKLRNVIRGVVNEKRSQEKEESKQERAAELALVISAIDSISDGVKNMFTSKEEVLSALSNLKIESPEVNVPEVNVPEIKIPEIKVPKPEVTVNVPEVETPVKALDSREGENHAMSSTAVKIVDSTSMPADTKSVFIQAANNNGNKIVYVATSSSKTTATSVDLFELGAGQGQWIGIGDALNSDIWAALDSGTGRLIVSYWKDSTAP